MAYWRCFRVEKSRRKRRRRESKNERRAGREGSTIHEVKESNTKEMTNQVLKETISEREWEYRRKRREELRQTAIKKIR